MKKYVYLLTWCCITFNAFAAQQPPRVCYGMIEQPSPDVGLEAQATWAAQELQKGTFAKLPGLAEFYKAIANLREKNPTLMIEVILKATPKIKPTTPQ